VSVQSTTTAMDGRASSGVSAGSRLRAAREAAGLSIDVVAQQLKLAPRQVTALEEDDWQRLPGRTFVRGFARNYARFVHLDPDALLALLPPAESAPALERPALRASGRVMGEIPVEREAKPSSARWSIPLLILALAGVLGYYEASRSTLSPLDWLRARTGFPAPTRSAPAAAPAATALPNPVPAPANGTAAAAAGPTPPTAPGTLALSPKVLDGDTSPARASDTNGASSTTAPPVESTSAPANASAVATPAAPAAATPAEAALVLTFRGTSWAEVKDAKGRVVLQMTGGAGMTQTVSGVPPLELALGNAPEVGVTFRGQPLDLAPYTRGNVARVALR
jgi:cytoskeleton protein RodZ